MSITNPVHSSVLELAGLRGEWTRKFYSRHTTPDLRDSDEVDHDAALEAKREAARKAMRELPIIAVHAIARRMWVAA